MLENHAGRHILRIGTPFVPCVRTLVKVSESTRLAAQPIFRLIDRDGRVLAVLRLPSEASAIDSRWPAPRYYLNNRGSKGLPFQPVEFDGTSVMGGTPVG